MYNNYLDGIDIIYWINLDRSKDRKKNMIELFKDEAFDEIKNKRIEAIDGKKKPNVLFNKLNIKKKKASITEYATLISHLEAINTFNKSNYDIALILEDDITLDYKKYWKKSIKQIMKNAPKDWEIIMVGYNYGNLEPPPELNDWSYSKNEYITEHAWGAYSYLINKKASKKIIDSCYFNNKYKLDENIHHSSDIYLYEILKTYVYKYPMFTYRTENDSYIHPWDVEGHVKSKEYITSQYENII